MSARADKTAVFEAIAVFGKAFASPLRLELLDLLAQAPRTVDQLAGATEQSMANTSQHLRGLHTAGLLSRQREGTSVRYSLAGPDVLALWLAVRDTAAARQSEVQRAARTYVGGEDIDAIDAEELRRRMASGDVVLLDVRPAAEYDAGHIEGALSVPIDELDGRLSELPAGHEVVAYCRGPYCAFAGDAVRTLTAAGIPARRLAAGYPEWNLAA